MIQIYNCDIINGKYKRKIRYLLNNEEEQSFLIRQKISDKFTF